MIDEQLKVLDACVEVLRRLKGGAVLDSKSLALLLRSTDDLQELSLKLKYMRFDLEATKRENVYLRKLLKDE